MESWSIFPSQLGNKCCCYMPRRPADIYSKTPSNLTPMRPEKLLMHQYQTTACKCTHMHVFSTSIAGICLRLDQRWPPTMALPIAYSPVFQCWRAVYRKTPKWAKRDANHRGIFLYMRRFSICRIQSLRKLSWKCHKLAIDQSQWCNHRVRDSWCWSLYALKTVYRRTFRVSVRNSTSQVFPL